MYNDLETKESPAFIGAGLQPAAGQTGLPTPAGSVQSPSIAQLAQQQARPFAALGMA